jgi:FdrA protein
MVHIEIKRNMYYDSVTLMLISKDVKEINGVNEVLVGMGTDLNKELAVNLALSNEELVTLSPNDFFIAADVDDENVMSQVIETVTTLLVAKKVSAGSDYRPVSLKSTLEIMPQANIAVVSIPGNYVEDEVSKLLDHNLHVMLFSDNVSIEVEKRLKLKAVDKGLLMMGPDCGTAIINGVPLAFANVINKGSIGIVGASGTGTQEVSCLIHQLGEGVSQVIGTGGRDLKEEIGGLMMLQGLEALIRDEQTKVIVLISKPPAPSVAQKILATVKTSKKPVVVDFIGGDATMIRDAGAYPCTTLEDAARKAVALANTLPAEDFSGFTLPESQLLVLVEEQVNVLKSHQRYLRGLYTGGTLADEAMKMLGDSYGPIYSNIPFSPDFAIGQLRGKSNHICLDLGEDQFTVGRPHPMIDPSTRTEHFLSDLSSEVAVLLFDVVLGYGSHEDPAGEVVKAVEAIQRAYDEKFIYIASITGTDLDPQNFNLSKNKLEEVGVIVMPSNAQAVRFTQMILKRLV